MPRAMSCSAGMCWNHPLPPWPSCQRANCVLPWRICGATCPERRSPSGETFSRGLNARNVISLMESPGRSRVQLLIFTIEAVGGGKGLLKPFSSVIIYYAVNFNMSFRTGIVDCKQSSSSSPHILQVACLERANLCKLSKLLSGFEILPPPKHPMNAHYFLKYYLSSLYSCVKLGCC